MQFSSAIPPIVCLLPSELRLDLKEQLLTLPNLVNFEYRNFLKAFLFYGLFCAVIATHFIASLQNQHTH
jgi:hypothetical protein